MLGFQAQHACCYIILSLILQIKSIMKGRSANFLCLEHRCHLWCFRQHKKRIYLNHIASPAVIIILPRHRQNILLPDRFHPTPWGYRGSKVQVRMLAIAGRTCKLLVKIFSSKNLEYIKDMILEIISIVLSKPSIRKGGILKQMITV